MEERIKHVGKKKPEIVWVFHHKISLTALPHAQAWLGGEAWEALTALYSLCYGSSNFPLTPPG